MLPQLHKYIYVKQRTEKFANTYVEKSEAVIPCLCENDHGIVFPVSEVSCSEGKIFYLKISEHTNATNAKASWLLYLATKR